MRVQLWTTAVACLLLAGGSLVRAQSPLPETGYFAGAPGCAAPYAAPAVPWGAGGDMPPAGAYATSSGAVTAGGEVYAWPEISPYEDYRFSQHAIENGLWHWEGNNDPRQYFFDVDGLFAKYRQPGRVLVGVEGAPPPVTLPFPTMTADAVVRGFGTLGNTAQANEVRGEQEPVEGGLKLTWGFFDADQTGLSFSAWAATEAYWFFQRGTNGDPADFRTPRLTGALPVDDGLGGVTIEYDRLYQLDFSSHGAGADAAVYFTPRWRNRFFRLQPLMGLRYVYIDEGFGFLGRDTGASYILVRPPGEVEDPNTFTAGIPYEGRLESDVTTHVFGPEVGIRYMLGGEHLRLVGESRVGLAANWEDLGLEGNGIGDGFSPNFNQISPFSRAESHTHVSPTTAHSLDAQMNILGLIPLVKRLSVLQHATLRVGYSIILVSEVARPHRTIEWNGLPLFPNIKTDRTRWHTHGWHVGLHFEY